MLAQKYSNSLGIMGRLIFADVFAAALLSLTAKAKGSPSTLCLALCLFQLFQTALKMVTFFALVESETPAPSTNASTS